MSSNEIRDRLIDLSEEKYKLFSKNLIPGTNNILGVRIPILKKLVKELDVDYNLYLKEEELFFEEVMLKGFIINSLKRDFKDKLVLIDNHINKINNWSTCDSFVSSLKPKNKDLELLLEYINDNIYSKDDYRIRFCVVALMTYYNDELYLNKIFNYFDNIKNDNYYVKMGLAWAISMFFVKNKELTLKYLNNNNLDNWTYNKSLQKIVESNKVSTDTKLTMKTMKRK